MVMATASVARGTEFFYVVRTRPEQCADKNCKFWDQAFDMKFTGPGGAWQQPLVRL